MRRSRWVTYLPSRNLILAVVVLLGACGGGGGGSSRPAPVVAAPPTGFDAGQFEASNRFKNLCAAPRTGGSFPDRQGSATDENNWLRSWSNELYLWYDEITDQNPRNFTTPEYFIRMVTAERTASGAEKDRFHFTLPTDEYEALAQSGIEAGYGARFVIIAGSPPRDIRVAFVTAGSPAALAGLVRGSRVVMADGVPVESGSNVDVLNAALFPDDVGEVHRFEVVQPADSSTLVVELTSAEVTVDPVEHVRVLDVSGAPVGYLHFSTHIATAEAELVEAFRFMESQGIADLVLDLRYNGGGFLDIANITASMIAGTSVRGRVFDEIQFNDKHPVTNPVTGETLEPALFHETTQGFSGPAGEALPTLDLPRVFVLTTARTCSASESIINGLRGAGVEVIQVGDTTCGKPFGFYPTDNCGTTYFSIQFQGVNALGFGDYPDGFGQTPGAVSTPGCRVTDDFGSQLGDPDERMLAAALAFQQSGSCPVGLQLQESVEGIDVVKPGPSAAEAADQMLVEPAFPGTILRP